MTALEKKLERAQARILLLEQMIEDRAQELYLVNQQLENRNAYLTGLYDAIPGAVLVLTPNETVESANRAAALLLKKHQRELAGTPLHELSTIRLVGPTITADDSIVRREEEWITSDGEIIPVLASYSAHTSGSDVFKAVVCVAVDLRERKRLEAELRHAQKLESVGQLAAGIAHEINTPMQFIGDNLHFLGEALTEVLQLVGAYRSALATGDQGTVEQLEQQVDLEFISNRVPRAVTRALDGVSRVSAIVAAMKAFAHPGNEKVPTDLNSCLETTLEVARNEYKYVANVETDFGEIPLIHCHQGDMNQVFLNLIVNAAHAIEAAAAPSGEKGTIRIRTRLDGDDVVTTISDTGCGIDERTRERIFDPFFTTKEVGKGSGQGLFVVRSIVVDKHSGVVSFESEVGRGTTFHIRLPARSVTKDQEVHA